MDLNWYVIRTKPQSENIAANALRVEGYEHFFPMIQAIQRRSGKEEIPLFPGYLFVRCDVDRGQWPAIGLLPGVLGWVRFDGVASSIADDVVDELARRVETINDNGGLWIRYKPGQKVRVVSGQFESLAQVADEPTSSDSKVRVLLEFMGQLVSAEVPWSDLRIAPEDSQGDANHGRRRRTRGRGRWIRNRGSEAMALS
jgi:transcriptional antiterminator RfaH